MFPHKVAALASALLLAGLVQAAPPGPGGPPPGGGGAPPAVRPLPGGGHPPGVRPPPGAYPPAGRPPPPAWGGGWRYPPRYGWYGGYGGWWGPGVGVYVGAPLAWAAWPYTYGWGATYVAPPVWGYPWGYTAGWPYATAPLVVDSAPAAPTATAVPPAAAPNQPATSYWYYCTQPAGYFPYVPDCEQPWLKVVPPAPGETVTPPKLAP